MRGRAARADLPDVAAVGDALPRQGLRRLRAGRPRQRAWGGARRTDPRPGRELRGVRHRSRARGDALVRPAHPLPHLPAPGPPREARVRMMRRKDWILFGGLLLLAFVPLLGGEAYTLRRATLACVYAAVAASWEGLGGVAGAPSLDTAAGCGLGAYPRGGL